MYVRRLASGYAHGAYTTGSAERRNTHKHTCTFNYIKIIWFSKPECACFLRNFCLHDIIEWGFHGLSKHRALPVSFRESDPSHSARHRLFNNRSEEHTSEL